MQTVQETLSATRRDRRTSAPAATATKARRRISVFGALGELLMTAGVVILLYVVWQLWVGDLIYGAQADASGQSISEQWQKEYEASAPQAPQAAPAAPGAAEPTPPVFTDPPALPQPEDGKTFALMRIPRFGSEYSRPIAGGTTRARTLDTNRIGHYTDAAMPGEVGNFSLAAHRTTYGAPFNRIAELRIGDPIVVETAEGWYIYRFRTLQYVTPSEVDVLLEVPQAPEAPPGERYITLTSCSPMFSLAERIIGYGLFEGFTPRSAGLPLALTESES